MATFTFIDAFKDFQGGAAPDMDFANDTFTIYLSDNAPIVATDSPKTDIPNITEENGYTETNLSTTWVEQSAGNGIFVLRHTADVSWTASGGSFGPFRYVVVYNNTMTTPLDDLAAATKRRYRSNVTNDRHLRTEALLRWHLEESQQWSEDLAQFLDRRGFSIRPFVRRRNRTPESNQSRPQVQEPGPPVQLGKTAHAASSRVARTLELGTLNHYH